MPDPAPSHQPTASTPGNSPAPATFPPLPPVSSPLSPVEIANTLDAAARRGKLPGFHKGPPRKGKAEGGKPGAADILFHITDFGTPCESIMDARARTAASGMGCELTFALRLKPTIPWIFAIVSILTVWPGIWLTDSMLSTYFTSYNTSWLKHWLWVWYLALTVPFVPLGIWQVIRKSRASATTEALDLISKIQTLVGTPVNP